MSLLPSVVNSRTSSWSGQTISVQSFAMVWVAMLWVEASDVKREDGGKRVQRHADGGGLQRLALATVAHDLAVVFEQLVSCEVLEEVFERDGGSRRVWPRWDDLARGCLR